MAADRNTRREKMIKCPFFKKLDMNTRQISCEGFTQGARTDIYFRNGAGLEKQLKQHCESFGYEQCPVFGMVYHARYMQ